MKNIILFILIASCFFGCSSNEEKETVLELSTTDILFSASEETKTFNIQSNESWFITQIPEWLTVDVKEGDGNKTITIKVKANPLEIDRSVTLKVSIKDKVKELKINQVAKNVTLAISKTELILPAETTDEVFSFDIVANELWSITDIPEWCTLSANEGDENISVTVIPQKNYLDTEREAIIKIKAGSKTVELKLKQKALDIKLLFSRINDLEYGSNSPTSVSAYCESSIKSVFITSNTKWGIHSKPTWVTVDKDIYEGNGYISLNIAENENTTDRKGEVIVSAGSKILKIIIRQGRLIEVTDNNPYQINLRDNAPHIGDELIKKQIEYVDPGSGGENITWDFSKLKVVNDDYRVSYQAPPIDGEGTYYLGYHRYNADQVPANSLIVCEEAYTWYYFQVKDNQLQEVGHENPTVVLNYDPRSIGEIYPSYYNTYYKGDYKSTYVYSATVSGETKGYKEVKADGYGTIILPTGTYANALRIRYVRTIDYLPEQYQEYTIYKWYVKGYRYPVLETHKLFDTVNNIDFFSTAFYYPPTDHTYLKSKKTKTSVSESKKIKKSIRLSQKESVLPILQLKRK